MRRIDLKREDGVAMTEFALIVPIFLLIVVGLLALRARLLLLDRDESPGERDRALGGRRPEPVRPGQTLQQHAAREPTVEFESDVKVCIDFPGDGPPSIGDPRAREDPEAVQLRPDPRDAAPITIRGSSTMRIERFANGRRRRRYTDGEPVGQPC